MKIKTKIKEMLEKIIYRYIGYLSDEYFVQFVFHLLMNRISDASAKQSLRLLFSLDALLYQVQGRMAVAYDNGIHTKHRHMKYHDFFSNRVSSRDTVLDIGCGIGAVAYDIAQVAFHVVGMDFNEASIKTAKTRYHRPNLEFRVGDALAALPDEKYNVVILSNVLEHLSGRPSFLRQVSETLHPDRILIRVPVFERDWRVPLKREIGVEWRLDPTHQTEYTLESFSEEMAEAGLLVRHLEVRWGEIWSEVYPVRN